MAKELTWRQAIDQVLGAAATPLHYNEITERILANQLRSSLGATPSATVNAQISSSIKHDGSASPYIRVARGTFALSKAKGAASPLPKAKLTPTVEESDESEAQYEIISSFGMFWRRDAVQWAATTKLLGVQQLGATPVASILNLAVHFTMGVSHMHQQ
ncbi:MAG: winged helix-turn-helix domain-containing protein [Gammaproteobacteria bacterium]